MGQTDDVLIVLFDGVCNLCNRFVQILLKLDKNKQLKFASLQGEFGSNLVLAHPELARVDSVLFYQNGKIYSKSSAILEICKVLPALRWFRLFRILPKVFRDYIYEAIARSRYAFFGKRDQCMFPTEELKKRFLD